MELHERIAAVRSRADLARFVEALQLDLDGARGEWENPTLERFLDAMGRWLDDVERPGPGSWADLAEALYAARGYE